MYHLTTMQKRAMALAVTCPACSAVPGEDCRFAPFDFIHHERRTLAVPDPEAATGLRILTAP
jgi:hypothetical protein